MIQPISEPILESPQEAVQYFEGDSLGYCHANGDVASADVQADGYVVRIRGASLYHEEAKHFMRLPNGQVARDLSQVFGAATMDAEVQASTTLPGTAAVFSSIWSGGFYHWFYNSLPRLKLLRESRFYEQIDWFIVDEFRSRAVREIFQYLDIPESKIFELPPRISSLVIPDVLVTTQYVGWPKRWACDYLVGVSKHLLNPQPRPVRILLGRQQVFSRQLVNFDKVRAALQPLGFEAVDLEMLSYKQQINLFAAAEAIVAVHGAGLSHLPFCQPGVPVVEIFNPRYVYDMYEEISRIRGLRYRSLIGTHVDSPLKTYAQQFDVAVSSELVLRTLKEMLL